MVITILIVGLLLISCGTTSDVATTDEYKYKVTVNLKDGIEKADLETAFQGEVTGWYPNSGLATIATNINVDDNSISQQGLLLDIFNLVDNSISTTSKARAIIPATQNGASAWSNGASAWSNGASAWSNGASAWSNGASAWSNGASAWSNGASAWSNGVMNGYFENNKAIFDKIRLFETHAKTKYFGQDVIVAVIDSGLDLNHPMFKDRLDAPQYWKDYIDGDSYPQDDAKSSDAGYGHGTAVAGVILQVAPRAKILPIRVIGPDGTGDTDDIAAAIEYAVANGAHIINLSLGTDEKDPAIEAMLSIANRADVLTIASAGNTSGSSLLFPANVANKLAVDPAKINSQKADSQLINELLEATGLEDTSVLGVSSVSTSDVLSHFSSYGATMDLTAPGESIVTAYPNSRFVGATGTSFAAPLVTGAMALAIGEVGLLLEPRTLLGLATATAENVSSKNNSSVLNSEGTVPRLDIYNFMRWGMGWDSSANTPITPEPIEPAEPTTEQKTIYSNWFNNGSGDLKYYDEMFSNSGHTSYEEGIEHTNNSLCKSNNSCLEVKLGGKDNNRKDQLSGAYALNFTLDKASEVKLSVQLRTRIASKYESDEYAAALIYVDDHFVGNNGANHITKLIGGGVSSTDSGWVSVNKSLGTLSAGEHFITIGAYNNKKTYNDEVSSVFIDNFKLTAVTTN